MIENEVLIEGNICKSITGQEDENGNFIVEVEASNENLDLQNQRTLQSALDESKEYFLTNGVISDDHQHKTRNPDGTVESHKDKIIGEPISVRKSGKSTFVKLCLYKGVEAAKPYINLLKNVSKLVKASIGGIMPTIRKEKDGTETVTRFMWNDLALTTSPVNWTVGSARFAKSIAMVDFCKSLEAGSGTNAAEFEGGRSLQKEDIEDETEKLLEINEGEMDPSDSVEKTKKGKGKFFDKEELIKASKEKNIKDIESCICEIEKGNLTNSDEITAFLIGKGFEKSQAKATMLEIIEQGGRKMAKGNLSETVDEILKSIGVKKSADKNEKPEDEKIEKEDLFEFDETSDGEDDEEDDVEKCGAKGSVKKGCGVKKSLDEEEDYLDATELVKSMGAEIDALRDRNDYLEKSIDEIKGSVIDIAKALGQPVARQSVVAKSIGNGDVAAPTSGNRKPSNADFDTFKNCVCKSAQGGRIKIEEVQFLNSEFQKSMKYGIKAVKPETWNKICSIVRENQK